MRNIGNSSYKLYELKVQNFLDGHSNINLDVLIEKIKAAAFLGEITDHECDYLLAQLPIDINNDIDEGWYPEEVTHKTGGIKAENVGKNPGIRKHIKDELDDYDDEDDEEEESGFSFSHYKKPQKKYDEFDDYDEDEDNEEDSGFNSLISDNHHKKDDELDDYDDEEDDEQEESGFSFSEYKKGKKEYDELDDYDEEDEDDEDDSSSGFFGLLKRK